MILTSITVTSVLITVTSVLITVTSACANGCILSTEYNKIQPIFTVNKCQGKNKIIKIYSIKEETADGSR